MVRFGFIICAGQIALIAQSLELYWAPMIGSNGELVARRLQIALPRRLPTALVFPRIGKSLKNHGKSWKIMVIIIMAFFSRFMVKLYLNNIFNGFIDFFCFILV